MAKQSPLKRKTVNVPQKNHSLAVWAVVSIASFPTVAFSLVAIGWSYFLAFLLACVTMLVILFIEGVVTGKIWIFHEDYRHIFDHQDTPFRILVVTGGVLLVLETLLLIQFFHNPAMDGFVLNIVARKQCGIRNNALTQAVCPLFSNETINPKERAVVLSMEEAALRHLMPGYTAGACSVEPLSDIHADQTKVNMKFFAYCQSWMSQGCNVANQTMAIVNSQMIESTSGFYAPLTWQEDRESDLYGSTVADGRLMQQLKYKLADKCFAMFNR
ncbi:MAG: hypothetical protein PHS79_02465 [Patescibacteria group bacterium]|nr:hypothetical protein [Patescibacteria group bacterium]